MAPKDNPTDPPSSYPGIWKYPSNRDVPFRMAEDWLSAKRKDDDIENLWRVYDKLYNFEPFIPNHPGGSDWLVMTRGTDITEAFESSHTVNVGVVEMMLEKFYVKDASFPRISPYTFKDNGFYKTLKRRIGPILKEVGTGPTKTILLMQDLLVVTFLALSMIGALYNSQLLSVLAGIVLGFSTIAAHNFFHLRENRRKYYFDLSFLSSYEWRITHFFSHHLYTNTVMDIELTLFPTYQFLPNRPKPWIQRYFSILYSHIIYAVGFWVDIVKRFVHIGMGQKSLRSENLIVLIELVVLIALAGDIQNGLKTWAIIHTVSSYTLLTIGATASHHHPEIFHDGDEGLPDPDFGIGQLDATRDRAENFFNNLFVTLVTFGHHPLHHLFPTICHSKLPYLTSVFQQTVREFKLNYPGIPQGVLAEDVKSSRLLVVYGLKLTVKF
ncbi:unnamed protein product [Orchesella dallaii]|uniref:Cytochrome b5 heme-binding domain-containing protein n=1 Tax=Orchesella dallaii TaxID=48710 RepID=A0ABP1Q982_9HEXA